MSAFNRLLIPLRDAAVAFFRSDVAVQRSPAGVHIVLEQRPAGGRKPASARGESRQQAASRKDQEELALALQQTKALLDERPETRQALRHLVFVEQALVKKGWRSLHKLPLDVLQRALEQLEGLVTNWSPVGLANLRSKMAVAIIDREHMDPEAEADAYRTAAVLDPVPEAARPAAPERSDDEALAAAYAALGNLAPAGLVETQAELGSRSARAMAPRLPRQSELAGELRLREIQA